MTGAEPMWRVVARLGRLGFARPEIAAEILTGSLRWWDVATNAPATAQGAAVVAAITRSADPDACLAALAGLFDALSSDDETGHKADELRDAVENDPILRLRLTALLGSSRALADHLAQHRHDWHALRGGDLDLVAAGERLQRSVGADPGDPVRGTTGTPAQVIGDDAVAALRLAYRRELIAVAGRDLAQELDLESTTAALTVLANNVLRAGLAVSLASLLAARGAELPACRLAVVAMGKTGGNELNYVSDVDVVFVAEPQGGVSQVEALQSATALASGMMQVCGAAAWEVDAALRPEGKSGDLVRTLASHAAYYRRWASTWEFQALLKANPVAGDRELGQDYVDTMMPMVWDAAQRPDFVADVQAMRRRVVALLPANVAPRELKLGPGGLRDVEFAVQLLQLVHGRADESLRATGTLGALRALKDGGYVGVDDAVSLDAAYRFLRQAEHALQLHRLRRTHTLPEDPESMALLARSMGFRPDMRGDATAVWRSEWALHVREVRRLHEKLFYRPLLEAVARVPSDQLRLTPEEAGRRLAALGFARPVEALRHIEALTLGVTRRAALQRALLPAMLEYFSTAPDPDAGLLSYRRVSDALGATPWYLRLLRDGGAVASRLAYVLGTSRYVAGMLERTPEALQLLADDDALTPRSADDLATVMLDAVNRHTESSATVAVVRGLRRQELLRIAFADLLGRLDIDEVNTALTAVADAAIEATLNVAMRAVARKYKVDLLPIRFAVIAMGRLGGAEIGYGSDADVMFVFDPVTADVPESDASQMASAVAQTMQRLLAVPSADPPLTLDADLRPEGRNGPLVRSLAAFARYYEKWSSAWEAQALLRARFLAGDMSLAEEFTALIDPVRYPAEGVSEADLVEIRRLKARIDTERLPRGADPTTHLKLGVGGLADVEWTVQLLQLAHGCRIEGLRTQRTLEALVAAREAELIDYDDAQLLAHSWRLASCLRNAIVLVQDKPSDELPQPGAVLLGVGRSIGYEAGFDPGQLIDDYRRAARRTRRVVEKIFYASR